MGQKRGGGLGGGWAAGMMRKDAFKANGVWVEEGGALRLSGMAKLKRTRAMARDEASVAGWWVEGRTGRCGSGTERTSGACGGLG